MKWAAAGREETMEQLSRTGNTLASCPLLSTPIRDIKGSMCVYVCVYTHRMNKRVLTRSEEEKKEGGGLRASVCVCECVCALWGTHACTHSLLCLCTMLSRKIFHDDKLMGSESTALLHFNYFLWIF